MEIPSYVLKGALAHKDSEHNSEVIPAGEFQLMSAGSGIRHSEFNASKTEKVHFLQIWIQPNVYGRAPSYQQKDFGREQGLTLVASPNGENGSLTIKQDARVYQLVALPNDVISLPAITTPTVYVHVIAGEITLEGQTLTAGDGVAIEGLAILEIIAGAGNVSALVFDLP